ncbi:MAG: glycosyltransferase family 2 protein [Planctomycetota bacterium]|nr:glycosyltransferase family 2 protein [Planctomycetota bacterium]
MTPPPVTSVTVTYKSGRTIGPCLRAAHEAHQRGLLDCVVVDNSSPDGTADIVEREHPWVRLVRSPGNIGFGRGNNLGFESVRSPLTLLLNPDAQMDVESLQQMIRFFDEHPRAGIAGPAIEGDDGHLQAAGHLPSPFGLVKAASGIGESHPGRRSIVPGGEPFRTDWISGAVLMIRSELFKTLGGFDPRFFLYFEETDLCRRAAAQGAELWAVGKAVARHVGGASSSDDAPAAPAVAQAQAPARPEPVRYDGCIAEHYFASRYYYLVKHHGWLAAAATEIAEAGIIWGKYWAKRARALGRDCDRPPKLKVPMLRLPAPTLPARTH